MSVLKRVATNTKAFIIDYGQRHAHPVNAVLHIVGVPLHFLGIVKIVAGKRNTGITLLAVGYTLQYLGHEAQGNELGEVILIKSMWRKIRKNSSSTADSVGGDTIV
jgi:hypothetical protein